MDYINEVIGAAMKKAIIFVFFIIIGAVSHVNARDNSNLPLRGVNLTGAELGNHRRMPGKHGREYLYPSPQDVAMYAKIGMNVIRVPFLWERMQPKLNAQLDEDQLEMMDEVVAAAVKEKVSIILDIHNYGKYRSEPIGSDAVPVTAYADFLSRLATHYKSNTSVIFGLMNKPHKQTADEWAAIAQDGINAIRNVGATQLILVPGTRYSEASRWGSMAGRNSNKTAMRKIKDPHNNMAFDVQQYFDPDGEGRRNICLDVLVGDRRLGKFTKWLRETGSRGFLSEFGVSTNPKCLVVLRRTLDLMEKNGDVWLGWTYWGASSWMKDYPYNIYPAEPKKFPQLKIIQDFLK